ncbi:hypothetical protein L3Q82_023038 [Scortum barcoo]|uniref:Uncharacterized protein n=1 Tax=Scortum barcoo TaxID=214431 RepID=A0ACB8WXM2_9TELE|nr:hypothetical protein L3Q82_023038 [Scortum barcoo]
MNRQRISRIWWTWRSVLTYGFRRGSRNVVGPTEGPLSHPGRPGVSESSVLPIQQRFLPGQNQTVRSAPPAFQDEPMQLGRTRLTPEERQRRLKEGVGGCILLRADWTPGGRMPTVKRQGSQGMRRALTLGLCHRPSSRSPNSQSQALLHLSGPERKAMDEYIEASLRSGIIRPSSSPAGAGFFFFFVDKDDSLRPCIDYSALNDITVKNRNPLPLISSAFEQLQQAKIFTKLDLQNAYYLVLLRLLENQLYVKAEKSEFHASSVSFLGFIVVENQVKMDPEKVSELTNWLPLTTQKKVQQFLGFANFYCNVYQKLQLCVAAPFHALTSSKVPFQWGP